LSNRNHQMSDKIKQIFNACNPNIAADDNYYIDCKKARGGDKLARKVKSRLNLIENSYLRFLFTGHIGSGKSSELIHLTNTLEEETNFFPIYADIKDYVNFENVDFDEILLAIAVEIADKFQTVLKINLKNNYFEQKFSGIKDAFLSKRKVTKMQISLFGLAKGEIQEIRQNDEAKRKLFEAISEDRRSLLDELNLYIAEANLQLAKSDSKYTKIVIIVDSLEKIQKFEDSDKGLASQKELFIEHYDKLTGIDTHTIYTVPLALYRSDASPKLLHYYGDVLPLPMVKIFHRGNFDSEYKEGCEAFKEILSKRFGEISLFDVFDKDALDFLVKYSGGNLRNMMIFIQESIISADELPISFKIARKSIQPTVRAYAASIKESYYPKLVALDADPHQQIDTEDPDFWTMLENLTVMEYSNGDETDRLDDSWYAVNPIVYEVGKFQTAKEEFKKSKKKSKK